MPRWKKVVSGGLLLLGMRLAMASGGAELFEELIQRTAEDGRLLSATVRLELGAPASPSSSPVEVVIATAAPSPSPEPSASPSPEPQEPTGDIVATTIYAGLSINNRTGYEADAAALLSEGVNQRLPAEGPQVLIIHTHGSEAYTQSGADYYEESDPERTEDTRYNVVRVGDELQRELEGCGLRVLHDRELYDYPSYTGSYSRSGAAVEAYLAEYPGIALVIDLHRDALQSGEVVYKTVAELDGEASSQVMFVVGTGENGLSHPAWRDNLKLALYLQQAMNLSFPTLARPVTLAQERYNQHLCSGSLILEVGSSGNTLREALCAVRLFAAACGPALAELRDTA